MKAGGAGAESRIMQPQAGKWNSQAPRSRVQEAKNDLGPTSGVKETEKLRRDRARRNSRRASSQKGARVEKQLSPVKIKRRSRGGRRAVECGFKVGTWRHMKRSRTSEKRTKFGRTARVGGTGRRSRRREEKRRKALAQSRAKFSQPGNRQARGESQPLPQPGDGTERRVTPAFTCRQKRFVSVLSGVARGVM